MNIVHCSLRYIDLIERTAEGLSDRNIRKKTLSDLKKKHKSDVSNAKKPLKIHNYYTCSS